ncbi:M28 family peptidase, partial [Acinetobacter baumannii]
ADPLTGRAPGANDDLSGVALTLESARLMATKKWRNTLVFVAFTGEEQALFGSAALAARAKKEAWKVVGVLNNDIVGASRSSDGRADTKHVR